MKKKVASNPAARRRRKAVISRLEEQLKKGTKPVHETRHISGYLPLTDKEKERIKKEIGILKTRII